ncbi:uncharacterized protein METZ01_LOCUS326948, partial [marine metagenome]
VPLPDSCGGVSGDQEDDPVEVIFFVRKKINYYSYS